MRLADWPRNPYLNEEVREWVRLHLDSLGTDDLAVYALAASGQDDERRILVASDVGLLDSWYAPHGSTARFSLSLRLYPWATVRGVDLRGETFRLWAREHQSRWRLRLARPALDTMADTPDLGRALAEFASACAVMAEQAGAPAPVTHPQADDPVPAFLGRATASEAARAARPVQSAAPAPAPLAQDTETASPPAAAPRPDPRPAASVARPGPADDEHPIKARQPAPVGPAPEDTLASIERRLGLRQPEN